MNHVKKDNVQNRSHLLHKGSKISPGWFERSKRPVQSGPISSFWTIFGFSIGLVSAAVVSYLFVRKRLVEQGTAGDQHIELPRDGELYALSKGRPAGEIRHIGSNGSAELIYLAQGFTAAE